jgi:hypothetical protein
LFQTETDCSELKQPTASSVFTIAEFSQNLSRLAVAFLESLSGSGEMVCCSPLVQGGAGWQPIVHWVGDGRVPLAPPQVRGEVMVLKGGVERSPVPMETERLTEAVRAGDTDGEMPPDRRGVPMEPLVKSMAAAEAPELTTGEGWRRSPHRHQQRDEHQPAMARHDPSPPPMSVPTWSRDARVGPCSVQHAAPLDGRFSNK